MSNLKEIRNRIRSVTNTQKITRAMKLVAAAKLRRAQDAVEASRPYADKMRHVIGELSAAIDEEDHPLFRNEEAPERCLIVVITSDRGLCGAFNAQLFRKIDGFRERSGDSLQGIPIAPVGRKGRDWCRREELQTMLDLSEIPSEPDVGHARELTEQVIEAFVSEEVDRVYLVFNEFVSALSQNAVFEQLLPLDADSLTANVEEEEEDEQNTDYIFEPSQEELLDVLLPQYVQSQVYRAFLESQASEQGARMTAMDNATNNANDLIDDLTLEMNRARQSMITTELMEITAGAEAIK
jgi:F-type H+-transporting ATPase subunit gamma